MFRNLPFLTMALALVVTPLTVSGFEVSRAEVENKDDPEVVFAYQGDAVLTQVGIDAAFSKIPAADRTMFIRDGTKVDRMVRNLMRNEVLALDAIANGLDKDPAITERILQAAYRELANAWLSQLAENAPEADYEAMAYEDYLANPEDYMTDPILDVSHILIGTESRSVQDALARADSIRVQILDGKVTFDDMVAEYSDDPAKKNNQGSYRRIGPGRMAPAFEEAAYELENPGDISEPVQTDFGYHLIRLDKRYEPRLHDYEEVKAEAIAEMEKTHKNEYREIYIRGLLERGIVLPEGSVEVMLKRHFGELLENDPLAR